MPETLRDEPPVSGRRELTNPTRKARRAARAAARAARRFVVSCPAFGRLWGAAKIASIVIKAATPTHNAGGWGVAARSAARVVVRAGGVWRAIVHSATGTPLFIGPLRATGPADKHGPESLEGGIGIPNMR